MPRFPEIPFRCPDRPCFARLSLVLTILLLLCLHPWARCPSLLLLHGFPQLGLHMDSTEILNWLCQDDSLQWAPFGVVFILPRAWVLPFENILSDRAAEKAHSTQFLWWEGIYFGLFSPLWTPQRLWFSLSGSFQLCLQAVLGREVLRSLLNVKTVLKGWQNVQFLKWK